MYLGLSIEFTHQAGPVYTFWDKKGDKPILVSSIATFAIQHQSLGGGVYTSSPLFSENLFGKLKKKKFVVFLSFLTTKNMSNEISHYNFCFMRAITIL